MSHILIVVDALEHPHLTTTIPTKPWRRI